MELDRGNLAGGTRWSPIFCWYRYLVAMPVITLCWSHHTRYHFITFKPSLAFPAANSPVTGLLWRSLKCLCPRIQRSSYDDVCQVEVWLHVLLTYVLRGGDWSPSRSGCFTPETEPRCTHNMSPGGWAPDQVWAQSSLGQKLQPSGHVTRLMKLLCTSVAQRCPGLCLRTLSLSWSCCCQNVSRILIIYHLRI
jgi:hypothetical protein